MPASVSLDVPPTPYSCSPNDGAASRLLKLRRRRSVHVWLRLSRGSGNTVLLFVGSAEPVVTATMIDGGSGKAPTGLARKLETNEAPTPH